MNAADDELSLAPRTDIPALAAAFARDGYVQIPNLLTDASAARLLAWLEAPNVPWNLVAFLGGQHRDLDLAGMDRLADVDRSRFSALVAAAAAEGFSYLFENVPIYDIHRHGKGAGIDLISAVAFINSVDVLSLVRAITGGTGISFADAQATRFRAGHFLNAHNDGIEGKSRIAAYVLGMTPRWRPDYGGLLLFEDKQGNVSSGLTPAFNVLNIFRVPRPHLVTQVASFTPVPRLSITGWFRAGAEA